LNEIEKQTDYLFIYSNEVNTNEKVSVKAKQKAVSEVLNSILSGKTINYSMEGNHIILSYDERRKDGEAVNLVNSIQQQRKTITGKVVDESGQSIPGVSIVIKGTSTGTISDVDGNFVITGVSENTVLVFSFVGMKMREVLVEEQTQLKIVMSEESVGLEEVVVTALGIQKEKKALGYAVQEVDGEDFKKAKEPYFANMLTGKVAGLTVYNNTNLYNSSAVKLRGENALLIVDGVMQDNSNFWDITSDDIENISILKGGTASALYGSAGKYGAIMITTKRGSKFGTQVEINSTTTLQSGFIRIPKVQSTYGAGLGGEYRYIDGTGGGSEGGGYIWGPKLDQLDPNTESGFVEIVQWNSPIDPETGERIPIPWISRGKNNLENFFRTGVLSTNNVNVTGVGEKGSFRVSGSNSYQKGIIPSSEVNIANFSLAGKHKLTDKLDVDASITYNKQFTDNYSISTYGSSSVFYNIVNWTGADVDIRDAKDYWEPGKEGIQQRYYNTSWYNNPYFLANEVKNGYRQDRTSGQVRFDYSLFKDFKIMARSGFNSTMEVYEYKEPKSFIGSGVSKGDYQLSNYNRFTITTDVIGTYNKQVTDAVEVTATIGGATHFNQYYSATVGTDGLAIPKLYYIGNSLSEKSGSSYQSKYKTNSFYGTLDLNIINTFYLGFTGRRDRVSTLPVNNNSYFYPSVSGSIVMSELLDLPNYFNFFKLRGSWSQVSSGSLPGGTYGHIEAYNMGVNWKSTPSLYFPGNRLNPDIKVETANTWEIGLDARFFKGRLGIDAAYYQVLNYNSIHSVPVSSASGYNTRLENAHEYLRKGAELTVTAKPIVTRDFNWEILGNWGYNRKYLHKIFGGADRIGYLFKGDRADRIYGLVYERTPGGQIIYSENGMPKTDSYYRFIGNFYNDWDFGIGNTFTYKNLSMHIAFDGRVGGTTWSKVNQALYWGGKHPDTVNEHRDLSNQGIDSYIGKGVVVVEGEAKYDNLGNIIEDTRVYAPNTKKVDYSTWVRHFYNSGNSWETSYYDATFAKLREITLSYQFPRRIIQNTFLKSATISLVGRNLYIWSSMPNDDPDVDPMYMDGNAMQTPSTRNYGININITF